MELALIVGGLLLLVVGYFCLGMLAKFLLGWWIVAFGLPVLLIVGFAMGWVGAIVAVVGFVILLNANNQWQGSALYSALERGIDKAFHLSDT